MSPSDPNLVRGIFSVNAKAGVAAREVAHLMVAASAAWDLLG